MTGSQTAMALTRSKSAFRVDSSKRMSGTSSAFAIQFNMTAAMDRVCVLQAWIPISYYLIPNHFNSWLLTEPGVAGSPFSITLAAGNYNALGFVNAVLGVINPNQTTSQVPPSAWTFSMTINDGYSLGQANADGLFHWTVSGNANVQPSFTFLATNAVNEQFGFATGSTNGFLNNQLQSTQVVNFQNEAVICIHSDMIDNHVDDVLQTLYQTNTPSLSGIAYQSTEAYFYSKPLWRNRVPNVANFYLTDSNNRPIDLNGQDWSMDLLFYKEENLFQDLRVLLQQLIQQALAHV